MRPVNNVLNVNSVKFIYLGGNEIMAADAVSDHVSVYAKHFVQVPELVGE